MSGQPRLLHALRLLPAGGVARVLAGTAFWWLLRGSCSDRSPQGRPARLRRGPLWQPHLHPPLPCLLGLTSPEPFCSPELAPRFRAWVSDCLLNTRRDTTGCPRTHPNQTAPLSPCPSPRTATPPVSPALHVPWVASASNRGRPRSTLASPPTPPAAPGGSSPQCSLTVLGAAAPDTSMWSSLLTGLPASVYLFFQFSFCKSELSQR